MSVNVTHLRSFWAVARLGGFSAAARELHSSQPSISRQIKDLEKGYGLVLLNRRSNAIELTAEGRDLYEICERAFGAIDEAYRFLSSQEKGSLSIHSVTTDVLSKLVSFMRNTGLAPRLTISIGTSQGVFDAILAGTCDLGLLTMPEENTAISTVEIGRYPLLAVLPPGHPLADRDSVSIHDIAQNGLICGSPQTQSRHYLEVIAAKSGAILNIAQEIDGYEMVGELTALGLGIGVIGYTGIVERQMPCVRPIEEGRKAIPVHLACLAVNRRSRLIDKIFRLYSHALEDFDSFFIQMPIKDLR